jgi:hypothetical protein
MVWVQAFPTGATLISQSVAQMQANNLALQTYANTDHFFNTGAPSEGHHRQVQLQNLGAVPAVALSSAIWSQNNPSGNSQPHFINSTTHLDTILVGSTSGTIGPVGAGTFNVLDFTGLPKCQGILMINDRANYTNSAFAFVSYGNGTVHVRQIVVHGTVTSIQSLTPHVRMTTTAGGTWEMLFMRVESQ